MNEKMKATKYTTDASCFRLSLSLASLLCVFMNECPLFRLKYTCEKTGSGEIVVTELC